MRRESVRAFTLVELMIVVSIVGVLAALGTYGVRLYIASAKTAEARATVGAIARSAAAAYNREWISGKILTSGQKSTDVLHQLCDSSTSVPATDAAIASRKYQPASAQGQDYNSGDSVSGWKCLKFSMNEAQYYRYKYTKGSKSLTNISSPAVPSTGYAVEARGNLNGDSIYSGFLMAGDIVNGEAMKATALAEDHPDE